MLEIRNGSSLTLKRKQVAVDHGGMATSDLYNNRILVSGVGSRLVNEGVTAPFCIGLDHGGNSITLEDGAELSTYQFTIGGAGNQVFNDNGTKRAGYDAVGRNTVVIRNHSVWTNIQYCTLGVNANSHSNSIHVLDGSEFLVGQRSGGSWAKLNIGQNGSSYNALVVSNSSCVVQCVNLGASVASHGNRFELLGPTAELWQTEGDVWSLFGSGYGNVVHVGSGAVFSYAQGAVDFGTSGAADNRFVVDGASMCSFSLGLTVGTGSATYERNAIEVLGGSTLSLGGNFSFIADKGHVTVAGSSTFSVSGTATFGSADYYTSDNEIFIADGSTFVVPGEIRLQAANSRMVVSNATVRFGDSNSSRYIYVGSTSTLAEGCAGTNVTLVLQGNNPILMKNGTEDYFLIFRTGTNPGLRFELPPEGYAAAPLQDVCQMQHGDDFRLEIEGVEAYQRTLTKSVTIPLIETKTNTGLNWLRNRSQILENVNAKLPKGCFVKIDATSGNDRLLLRVRALTGLLMVVR